MLKKGLFFLILIWMLQGAFAYTVTTTDFSYLLPHNGQMLRTASDVTIWGPDFDGERFITNVIFNNAEGYVALRSSPADTWIKLKYPRVGVGPNLNFPLEMSSKKRLEFLVQVTLRGATYCGGTIFGQFQPVVNSGFWGGYDIREKTISPGYLEAFTIKCIEDRDVEVYQYREVTTGYSISTIRYNHQRAYTFGTFAVTTEWMTLDWHFYPTQENYFKLGYIGVIYVPNPESYDYFGEKYRTNDSTIFSSISLPFTTEVQIKEIKLYGLSYDYDD